MSDTLKKGDRVIVHTCPRVKSELGWTGTVTKEFTSVSRTIEVLIDGKSAPYLYDRKHLRKLTKLDKALA